MLKVSRQSEGAPEIFHSVQGEGTNIGMQAVFLRLATCNLACRWCDTKYTWDWAHYDRGTSIIEMNARDIEKAVLAYRCRRLVVTGGEPLVQQGELAVLLRLLKGELAVEVETNGTIVPVPELCAVVDHWNVSPKMASSGNSQPVREVAAAYDFFRAGVSADFKFVVDSEADFAEVEDLVARYGITPERVILMPQAVDRDGLIERGRWLTDLSRRSGYRVSTRLQVLFWGSRRGV